MMTDLGPVLLEAITAARNAIEPDAALTAQVLSGGEAVVLDALEFDSLAWMEFCISVELQTGAQLAPDVVDGFTTLAEVAGWIVAHRTA